MKVKNSIQYTLLLSLLTQQLVAAEPTDWEKEYKNLCSYDFKFCGRVKNSDGTFAKPKKEIVALLKELTPYIQKSAQQLGVDPRAIAGAIMAENSLNVGISDSVQNLLVKIGVANKGEVLGKKFSYGLGQLNFSAAREAEDYAASLENRKPLDNQELQDAILTPEKSIYLVGAVIRKVQDDYKKQGFDISGKPEILSTLYNLGRSEEKAAETKRSGNLPRPNYFGFFVNKYSADLAFLKKPEVIATKVAIPSSESVVVEPSAPAKANGSIKTAEAPASTKSLKLAFTKSMPLYTSPPTCKVSAQEYGATNIQHKYDQLKVYAVTAIAEKEKSFVELAPTIDCETNAWKLIKLSSGEAGWIKKDDLEKSTAKIMLPDMKCSKSPSDNKCVTALNARLKEFSLTSAKAMKGGEIFAKPYSTSEKVSFAQADWECVKPEPAPATSVASTPAASNTAGVTGMGMGMGRWPGMTQKKNNPTIPSAINTDEDLKGYYTLLENKEKAFEKKYGRPATDPSNPLSYIQFPYLKIFLDQCTNKQKYGLAPCQIDKTVFGQLVDSIKVDEPISISDRLYYHLTFRNIITSGAKTFLSKDDFQKAMRSGSASASMPMFYGGMALSDQYKVREGDEQKWSMDDISSTLKECAVDMDLIDKQLKLNSNKSTTASTGFPSIAGGFGFIGGQATFASIKSNYLDPALSAIDEIKAKPSDEQEKNWKFFHKEYISMAKICISLKDLYQLPTKNQSTSASASSYSCFFQGLEVLDHNNELLLKSILRETYSTSEGIASLMGQFQMTIDTFSLASMGIGQLPSTNAYAANSMPTIQAREVPSSYCPNRTAEMIEEILKENSCVQRVYVPDRWLLSRLNELGDRVVYRPFAEDDRYSFDVEKTQCN